MRLEHGRRKVMRLTNKWLVGGALAIGVVLPVSLALAGNGPSVTLSIVDTEGEAGSTVGVPLNLSGDDGGAAASAGIDIVYPDGDVTFTEPVADNCVLDDRISSTHQVSGRILSPGTVNVEISVLGAPDPIPPLGNGDLVVCNFGISGDAMEGEMFTLEATNVLIGDQLGMEIDSIGDDGVISVGGGATPTPTTVPPTEEPTPTATATVPVCTEDRDCPTGTTCQDGTCLPQPCDPENPMCPPGSDCLVVLPATTSGTTDTGTCVPRPCDEDEDCDDPSAVCDPEGMCRPQFCDNSEECDSGEECSDDGICVPIPPECEEDSQCPDGVCVNQTCVDCRENSDCGQDEMCVDNECEPIVGAYSLDVGDASGLAGTTVAVEVTLSGGATSADSVTNDLAAGTGLTIASCDASEGIDGSFEGVPGTTVSATLGETGDVPVGVVYSCSVAIAEGVAAGTVAIECPAATANGSAIDCDGGEVGVIAPPTATPTNTPTEEPTLTPIPATSTPTVRVSTEDDSCAIAPAPTASDAAANFLLLLIPAAVVWRRRR